MLRLLARVSSAASALATSAAFHSIKGLYVLRGSRQCNTGAHLFIVRLTAGCSSGVKHFARSHDPYFEHGENHTRELDPWTGRDVAAPAREGLVSCGGSTGGGCTMGPSPLVTSHSMKAGMMRTCSTGAALRSAVTVDGEAPTCFAVRGGWLLKQDVVWTACA